MACPTCDHTMQTCDTGNAQFRVCWCPRCGSLQFNDRGRPIETSVPKLVERCREFDKMMNSSEFDEDLWRRLGISESIHLPANRPGGEQ